MPLTSLAESDQVAVWRDRIGWANKKRQEFKKIADRNVDFYRGHQWADWDDKQGNLTDLFRDHMIVNKIFSSVRADLPTLHYTNPSFNITPRRPFLMPDPQNPQQVVDMSFERAKSQQMLLNYVFRELNGEHSIRMLALAAKLGLGVVKVGYTGVLKEPEADKRPLLERILGTAEDEEEILILARELFFLDWVPWDNMLFDPDGGNDFNTHRWVIEEWVRPLSEVRDNPLLKKTKNIVATDQIGAKPGDTDNKGLTTEEGEINRGDPVGSVKDDRDRVRGYDIYDFENDQFHVIAEASPDGEQPQDFFLEIDKTMPGGMERGPYVFLKFNEDPCKWYPITDVEQLIPLQVEYNDARTAVMVHKRRSCRKILIGENALGSEADQIKEKLQSDEDMEIIEGITDINQIKALEQPHMDAVFAQDVGLQQLDFNDVAGQSGESRGVADAKTATQSAILEGRGQLRQNDRRDNSSSQGGMQGAVTLIGRKLLQTLQANMPDELWVKVGDPRQPEPFPNRPPTIAESAFDPVIKAEIQGEFDVSVAVGSMLPRNTAFYQQQLTGLITAVSQNPLILTSKKLMRRVFESFDIYDPEMLDELMAIGQAAMQQEAGPAEGANGVSSGANPLQGVLGAAAAGAPVQ